MTSNKIKDLVNSLELKFVQDLLGELLKTKKVKVPVVGVLKDATIVGLTTFFGSMAGGPVGAVAGAATGTVILGVSKFLGYYSYKPLLHVISEDLTEEERKNLYEGIWNILTNRFGTTGTNIDVNQLQDSATVSKKTIENNPEVMETIMHELKTILDPKNMSLAETN